MTELPVDVIAAEVVRAAGLLLGGAPGSRSESVWGPGCEADCEGVGASTEAFSLSNSQ